MTKKCIALLLASLLLLSMSGCGSWGDDEQMYNDLSHYYQSQTTEDSGRKYPSDFGLPYESAQSLDPITCSDGIQSTLGALLFEGLYRLDTSFCAQPVLAESSYYDPTTLTYTIRLKNQIFFSDGSPVTEQDVVDTLVRASSSTRYSGRFHDVASITCENNRITIVLTRPNTSFTACLDVPIVKSGTENNLVPIGTGPYVVSQDTQGPCLLPNSYWNGETPLPLERMKLVDCKDSDALSYAYTGREVQLVVSDLTGTSTTNFTGGSTYTDAATTTILYLGFNTNKNYLNQSEFRSALSSGLNREGLVNAYLLGHGTPAQFPISPYSSLYPSVLETTYSLSEYQSAIASMDLSEEKPLELNILVNEENEFKVALAEGIATAFTTKELIVHVVSVEYQEYLSMVARGIYDIYLGECRLSPDWNLSSVLNTTILNYSGYQNEALQQAIDADSITGIRTDSVAAVCRLLQEQSPIAPICFKNISVLVTSGVVENLVPTASNPFYNYSEWVIHLEETEGE